MDIYLLTAFFVVYTLAVVLCSQVGFPRAAKLGFLLIAVGLVVMVAANAFAFNALRIIWNVPQDSPEGLVRVLSGAQAWLLVSRAAIWPTIAGVVLSFSVSVHRVVTRRKQVFRFRSTDGSVRPAAPQRR